MPGESPHALKIEAVSKTFGERVALQNVSLSVDPGEVVGLLGPSGSGKSTLLRLVSGLICCDESSTCIAVNGDSIQVGGKLCSKPRAVRKNLGFVFQQFNLVNRLSVLTNVMIGRLPHVSPMRSLLGLFTRSEKREGMVALQSVGIADHAGQRADTLSGGQKQRVAIARVLMQQAPIILADEPIASLDPSSARQVMHLLTRLCRKQGKTLIVSLHQVEIAKEFCDRIVALHSGQVVFDGPSSELQNVALTEIYGADAIRLSDEPEAAVSAIG